MPIGVFADKNAGDHVPRLYDLPTEGVTYFMEYPNGEETVTESYEEAIEPEEKLIAELTTNANGEIILNDWNSDGQLRIVQEVPEGYSTQERELEVNLANSDSVVFTDFRGLVNPNTGRTIAIYVLTGILAILLIIDVIQKGKTKQITTFLILGLLLFVSSNVKANEGDFVIRVKDGTGNGLGNVKIKIYAKPINVEASPAVKYDANGGEFLDGTTAMYFRIPYNGCTFQEYFESLPDEEIDYLRANYDGVTREGFVRTIDKSDPDYVNNGTTINVTWEENPDAHVVTIDGNGAIYNIGRKQLSRIKVYEKNMNDIFRHNDKYFFEKDNKIFSGYDNNASCTNYQYGLAPNTDIEFAETFYQCWFEEPDGVYIYENSDENSENKYYFPGNKDLCFSTQHLQSDNTIYFGANMDKMLSKKIFFKNINEQQGISFKFTKLLSFAECYPGGMCEEWFEDVTSPFTRIRIVYQGNMLLDLSGDALTSDEENMDNYPTSSSDREALYNYFDGYIDRCFSEEALH